IAALAPIPSASVRTTVMAKPFARASDRRAKRRSVIQLMVLVQGPVIGPLAPFQTVVERPAAISTDPPAPPYFFWTESYLKIRLLDAMVRSHPSLTLFNYSAGVTGPVAYAVAPRKAGTTPQYRKSPSDFVFNQLAAIT